MYFNIYDRSKLRNIDGLLGSVILLLFFGGNIIIMVQSSHIVWIHIIRQIDKQIIFGRIRSIGLVIHITRVTSSHRFMFMSFLKNKFNFFFLVCQYICMALNNRKNASVLKENVQLTNKSIHKFYTCIQIPP